MTTDFSDLDEDLGPSALNEPAVRHESFLHHAASVGCPQCRGSGKKIIGYAHRRAVECFNCKGSGKVSPNRERNVARYKQGLATQATNLMNRYTAFQAANPDVIDWLNRNNGKWEFATSLFEQLTTRGSLSENQIAAVRRSIEKAVARITERAANAQVVNAEGLDALTASLQRAKDNGKKKAMLIIGKWNFSLAKASSVNAGAVYVKQGREYAGKVMGGRFLPARGFDAISAEVAKVLVDPLAAAKEHGYITKQCSCCGLTLTDPKSIAAGIGPICAQKFFG